MKRNNRNVMHIGVLGYGMIVALLTFLAFGANAGDGDFFRVKSIGGTSYDEVYDIAGEKT